MHLGLPELVYLFSKSLLKYVFIRDHLGVDLATIGNKSGR